jgi:16S rRNA (cytosine1407-C5)-methyltransferase
VQAVVHICSKILSSMVVPDAFKLMAECSLGAEVSERLFGLLLSPDVREITSIRLNRAKSSLEYNAAAERIFGENLLKPVPWSEGAFYLKTRPEFTFDPLFNSGAYYVQDASCMFMESVWQRIVASSPSDGEEPLISLSKPIYVLDLCAAPGGKSTILSDLMREAAEGSLLVSNEVIGGRAAVLAENMAKWGDPNVIVTNNDPSDFKGLHSFFDIVLVDAPCSGEGMFSKNEEAAKEWSEENVQLCAARQKRILSDIWSSVKPGGILIYSTCTFNHFENSDNLSFIVEKLGGEELLLGDSDFKMLSSHGVIRVAGGGYQFVPPFVEGEGQYFAIVRKMDGDVSGNSQGNLGRERKKEKVKRYAKSSHKSLVEYAGWVEERRGDLVKLYASAIAGEIGLMRKSLKILSSGTAVAMVKGKDMVPYADLALSSCCDVMSGYLKERYGFSYAVTGVSREEALKFLAREQLVLPEAPKGYLLLVYEGFGIGFVKNLGNRCNILLPNARRIRSSQRR